MHKCAADKSLIIRRKLPRRPRAGPMIFRDQGNLTSIIGKTLGAPADGQPSNRPGAFPRRPGAAPRIPRCHAAIRLRVFQRLLLSSGVAPVACEKRAKDRDSAGKDPANDPITVQIGPKLQA